MNHSRESNHSSQDPARPVRSLLIIQLENERQLLEVMFQHKITRSLSDSYFFFLIQIQHRQQIDELNRCMIAGQDLATAARRIFGPPVDRPRNPDIPTVNVYYMPPQRSNPASHSNPSNPNHPANRNHRYE